MLSVRQMMTVYSNTPHHLLPGASAPKKAQPIVTGTPKQLTASAPAKTMPTAPISGRVPAAATRPQPQIFDKQTGNTGIIPMAPNAGATGVAGRPNALTPATQRPQSGATQPNATGTHLPSKGHLASTGTFLAGHSSVPPGGNPQPFRGLSGRQLAANKTLMDAAAKLIVDQMNVPKTQILYPLIGPAAMESLVTWSQIDDESVIANAQAMLTRFPHIPLMTLDNKTPFQVDGSLNGSKPVVARALREIAHRLVSKNPTQELTQKELQDSMHHLRASYKAGEQQLLYAHKQFMDRFSPAVADRLM